MSKPPDQLMIVCGVAVSIWVRLPSRGKVASPETTSSPWGAAAAGGHGKHASARAASAAPALPGSLLFVWASAIVRSILIENRRGHVRSRIARSVAGNCGLADLLSDVAPPR